MTGQAVLEEILSGPAETAHAALAALVDSSRDVDLRAFVGDALDALGANGFPATVRAFDGLARVVADSMAGNPYHAPGHAADVVASALYLARIERAKGGDGFPNARQTLVLLAAALGHDCWHDGGGNVCPETGRRVAFRLERLAARETAQHMRGIFTPAECAQIETMILATDPAYRRQLGALVDLAYEAVTLSAEELERLDVPAPLAAIAQDRDLARLCGLLADADIFPSTGFGYAQCARQARRVEQEMGCETDAVDDTIRGFLENVVGPALLTRAGAAHAGSRRAIGEAVGTRVPEGPAANYPALFEGLDPPDWRAARDTMRVTLTRRTESVTITKQGLRLSRREGQLLSIARAEPGGDVRVIRAPKAVAPSDRPLPKRPGDHRAGGERTGGGRGSPRPRARHDALPLARNRTPLPAG